MLSWKAKLRFSAIALTAAGIFFLASGNQTDFYNWANVGFIGLAFYLWTLTRQD